MNQHLKLNHEEILEEVSGINIRRNLKNQCLDKSQDRILGRPIFLIEAILLQQIKSDKCY